MPLKRAAPLVATLGLALLDCQESKGPRRQVIVYVDTDAPTVEQSTSDAKFSRAAVIDTVRVDLLAEDDTVQTFRELSATSNADWPLSFALVPPEAGASTKVRLRVRGFRAHDATSDIEQGTTVLTADPTLSIDRVIEIPMPAAGVVDNRSLVLRSVCFGRPTSFGDHTSCIEDTQLDAPFSQAAAGPAPASAAGTGVFAREVGCAEPGTADRICIPGGLSVLGSKLVVGAEDEYPSVPVRLVRLSPFYMDRTEVTVARARSIIAQLGTPPIERNSPKLSQSDLCTFTTDGSTDELPLNCIPEETAHELCELAGGTLPTEAQWSHAATGRGEDRRFPWGDSEPECCTASTARNYPPLITANGCPGDGVEPVASHVGTAACVGDVSRDGIVDMGGSLTEMLADQTLPLGDACWGETFGVLTDPLCTTHIGISILGSRGSNWSEGQLRMLNGFRRRSVVSPTLGMRCVYPAKAAP